MGGLFSRPKAPQIPASILQAAAAPVPAAPAPLPVTPMPDAGDVVTQAANRKKAAAAENQSGRLSTILTSSSSGDKLGS